MTQGKNMATTISKLPKYAKIGICTPLKSAIYFRFVSETIAVEPIIFPSGMQNLVKIGKQLRTKSFDNWLVDTHTHTHTHMRTDRNQSDYIVYQNAFDRQQLVDSPWITTTAASWLTLKSPNIIWVLIESWYQWSKWRRNSCSSYTQQLQVLSRHNTSVSEQTRDYSTTAERMFSLHSTTLYNHPTHTAHTL